MEKKAKILPQKKLLILDSIATYTQISFPVLHLKEQIENKKTKRKIQLLLLKTGKNIHYYTILLF
jgi:hypothetical protein